MGIIKQVRLALLAKRGISEYKKGLASMGVTDIKSVKPSWPLFFMGLGVLAHGVTNLSNIVPGQYKPLVENIGTLLGALGGFRALFINPDGTSAKAPWTPDAPKK